MAEWLFSSRPFELLMDSHDRDTDGAPPTPLILSRMGRIAMSGEPLCPPAGRLLQVDYLPIFGDFEFSAAASGPIAQQKILIDYSANE